VTADTVFKSRVGAPASQVIDDSWLLNLLKYVCPVNARPIGQFSHRLVEAHLGALNKLLGAVVEADSGEVSDDGRNVIYPEITVLTGTQMFRDLLIFRDYLEAYSEGFNKATLTADPGLRLDDEDKLGFWQAWLREDHTLMDEEDFKYTDTNFWNRVMNARLVDPNDDYYVPRIEEDLVSFWEKETMGQPTRDASGFPRFIIEEIRRRMEDRARDGNPDDWVLLPPALRSVPKKKKKKYKGPPALRSVNSPVFAKPLPPQPVVARRSKRNVERVDYTEPSSNIYHELGYKDEDLMVGQTIEMRALRPRPNRRAHSLSAQEGYESRSRFRSLPSQLPPLSPGRSMFYRRPRSLTRSRSPSPSPSPEPVPPPQSGISEFFQGVRLRPENESFSLAYTLGVAFLLATVAGVLSE
jgi:hypothetical protein